MGRANRSRHGIQSRTQRYPYMKLQERCFDDSSHGELQNTSLFVKRGEKKKSFTLIELLVVIAIIALLAAILLPVLQKARTTAGQVTCANSHKQLASTMMTYAGDNDGKTMAGLKTSPYGSTWRFQLAEYLCGDIDDLPQYKKVLATMIQCPAGVAFGMAFPEEMGSFRNSYIAYNHYSQNTKISSILQPSQKLMFCDVVIGQSSNRRVASNKGSTRVYYRIATDSTSDWGVIHCRHNGNANIAWFDGHVSSLHSPNFRDLNAVYAAENIKQTWFQPLSRR